MHRWFGPLLLVICCMGWFAPGSLEAQTFIRGDANNDGVVNIADSIFILSFVSVLGPPPMVYDAADVNDNGEVEIADAAYHLLFLFAGGLSPPLPFPAAGTDTTPPNFPTAPTGIVEYRLDDVSGCPGGQTLLPLLVSNQVVIEAMNVRVVYDPSLITFGGASDSPLIPILGDTPDFFNAVEVTPGVVQVSTLFSLINPTGLGLPIGSDQRVIDLILGLDVSVGTGQSVPVSLADDPTAFPPQFNLASINGEVELALTTDGSITGNCTQVEFRRGDTNEDGTVSISDAVFIVRFLFLGGPASQCERTNDVNADTIINVADAIAMLNALFSNGPSIPLPYPACGIDPLASPFDCTVYPANCP